MLCLGALGTLSMPPWTLWPLLWIIFPGLLLVLETAKSWRHLFALGWAFGFGYFATGFGWMTNAFFVDRETFAALAVPAVGGLAAGFGVYIGVCATVMRVMPVLSEDAGAHMRTKRTTCFVVLFACTWTVIEWWRGWFLTGLPWNLTGTTWIDVAAIAQAASVVGVYGLTFVTVLAAGSGLLLFRGLNRRVTALTMLGCHLPLIAFGLWGQYRVATAEDRAVPGVMLRLVQPNIPQIDKWRPALREQHLLDQVSMSTQNAAAVTHVLWAETAAPFALNRAPQALSAAALAAPEGGYLLAGAPRIEGTGASREAYNSLYAVSQQGEIDAVYDKAHLVPFGEYMPLRDLIPIENLAGGSGWNAGPGVMTLDLPGLPAFSPLICYEIIFPGSVAPSESRPAWLFNLTNDAWFGMSSGPHQHFAAARLRAIEEGLPVVRVANTGISAVIDPYGRPLSRIALGQRGVIDSRLPEALPPTVFVLAGHGPILGFAFVLAGLCVGLSRKTLDKI